MTYAITFSVFHTLYGWKFKRKYVVKFISETNLRNLGLDVDFLVWRILDIEVSQCVIFHMFKSVVYINSSNVLFRYWIKGKRIMGEVVPIEDNSTQEPLQNITIESSSIKETPGDCTSQDSGQGINLRELESWLPITESRNGNTFSAMFHLLCSGIGFQALLLPVAFATLWWWVCKFCNDWTPLF